MTDFETMLTTAAEIAASHARARALSGDLSPMRLYVKRGWVALQSEGCSYDLSRDGWIATEYLLGAHIPYSHYRRWLQEHAHVLARVVA